jgi:hypothetical protein
MPFSFPEPGLLHLVIPETGWDPDDRAACMKALADSCAERPTGFFLESNLRKVSADGPNLMVSLFEQLQDRIVCLAVATESSLLQLTVIAFRAAAGLRGLRFPIHLSDDAAAMRALVTKALREREGGAPDGPGPTGAHPS